MDEHGGRVEGAACTTLTGDLSQLIPGPKLSQALALIDPRALNGAQLVDLIVAHNRQISYEQGRLLRALNELAHTPPGDATSPPDRLAERDPHAGSEAAFALTLTEYAAGSMLDLAATLAVAPALADEMEAGRLDLPKLKVIGSELDLVDPVAARAVVSHLIPDIPRCTTGQLRRAARQLVLEVAPDAAGARHSAAVKRRKLIRSDSPHGTSCLSGRYLSPEKAMAAWENVDAIAQATRAAGDPLQRGIDQIRADVFADLLAGVDPTTAGAAKPGPRRGVVNVRIDLETLAGWSRAPGEFDGFGPVLAEAARETVRQIADRAEWRFSAIDREGRQVAEGRLQYRPTLAQRRFVQARDRTCIAPGCRMPAVRCDIDHVVAWSRDGLTTVENLVVLCRRHHRAKHCGRHRLRHGPLGMEWTTPRGRRYVVVPRDATVPSALELTLEQLVSAENIMASIRR